MNTLRILCLLAALAASSRGADWQAMADAPAVIKVINMQPAPLVESDDKNGWLRVPPKLAGNGATIYMPENAGDGGGKTNGVADITVVASGYLLLACNYYYQGNSSGDWQKEVWDAREFKRKGWHLLSKGDMGGLLLNGGNQDQTVFYKKVNAGQNFRLRCNKYKPPYPIVLAAVAPTPTPAPSPTPK